MGGTSKTKSSNKRHGRTVHNNELLLSAIVEVAKEHQDDLPFTAMEVNIKAGKPARSPIITRDRGGLTNLVLSHRAEFIDKVKSLVSREKSHTGKTDKLFCQNLGFLFVDYSSLFEVDVILGSHRNTEVLLNALKPLIHEKHQLIFGAKLYQLFTDWRKDGFTRLSVIEKYRHQLWELFVEYQITRPDMAVTSSSYINDPDKKADAPVQEVAS